MYDKNDNRFELVCILLCNLVTAFAAIAIVYFTGSLWGMLALAFGRTYGDERFKCVCNKKPESK